MAPLGPFERPPRLAVAVSGGADSMALALLARRWVAERGGDCVALTVDHGLRPAAANEAAQVGAWLAAHGIAHATIRWDGPKPRTGIQQAARDARYRLLLAECRRRGIIHLLVAHHRDDQAETVRLRAERGSGPDGLAAMASGIAASSARLLRPLLAVPRARLEATLIASGQDWIDDPSNRDPAYARVALRGRWAGAAGEEADKAGLIATAQAMAQVRAAREAAVAALLARVATVHPQGFVTLGPAELMAAPRAVALGALDRVLRLAGGAVYPLPKTKLSHVLDVVGAGKPARLSLGGCLVGLSRRRLVVTREPAATGAPVAVPGGGKVRWDGRFGVVLNDLAPGHSGAFVGALGQAGWQAIRKQLDRPDWPIEAIVTLPALFDAQGLAEVPHLGWRRGPEKYVESAAFDPELPLTGAFRIG